MCIPPTLLNTRKRKLRQILKLPKLQILIVARVSAASRTRSASLSGFRVPIVGESPVAYTATFRGIAVVLASPDTLGSVPGKVGFRDARQDEGE